MKKSTVVEMSGRERCLEEEQVDEEDDQPDPQTLQMSQTCWEFKSLQVSRRQHHHGDGDGDYDDDCDGDGDEKPPGQSGKRLHDHEGFPHQPEEKSEIIDDPDSVNRGRKRLKLQAIASMRSSQQAGSPIVTKSSASPRIMEGQTKTTTTSLQACRDYAANSDVDAACGKSPTRDLFVLVVQCSGLQCITSKAGYDVTLSTLLVADPTFSFFKVTLWRHMGERAARMIRAGDLVRLNRSLKRLDLQLLCDFDVLSGDGSLPRVHCICCASCRIRRAGFLCWHLYARDHVNIRRQVLQHVRFFIVHVKLYVGVLAKAQPPQTCEGV